MEKTHKEKIDIIYINPPCNTENNDFSYGNETLPKEDKYKHSKWLSFMERRLKIVCDNDNKIWIIETKDGENVDGESKNIDIK